LLPGQRVAIIEDVVTTGGSSLKAVEPARICQPKAEIVGVYALVDRLDGGGELLAGLGIPLVAVFTKDDLV
jgi:orotate phosphoribosyltransferase